MNKTKLSIIGGAVTAIIGVSCLTSAIAGQFTTVYVGPVPTQWLDLDSTLAFPAFAATNRDVLVIDQNGECFGDKYKMARDGNGMPTGPLCGSTMLYRLDRGVQGFTNVKGSTKALAYQVLTPPEPKTQPDNQIIFNGTAPWLLTYLTGDKSWRTGMKSDARTSAMGKSSSMRIHANMPGINVNGQGIFKIVSYSVNTIPAGQPNSCPEGNTLTTCRIGDIGGLSSVMANLAVIPGYPLNKSLWITNNLPKTGTDVGGIDAGDNNYIRLLPCAGISAGNSNCESVKTTLNGAIDNDYFLPAGSPTPTKPDASGITKEVLPYSSCNKNYNNKHDSPHFNNVDQYNSTATCLSEGVKLPCLINTLNNPNQNACATDQQCVSGTITYYNRFRNAWAITGPQQSQIIFPFVDQRADAIQWGAKFPIPVVGEKDTDKQMGSGESEGNACYLYAYLGGRVGYDIPDYNGSSHRLGYLVFENGKLSPNSLLSLKAHLGDYNAKQATVDGVKNADNPYFDVRYDKPTGTLIFNQNKMDFSDFSPK